MVNYLNPKHYARGIVRTANIRGLSMLESLWAKDPNQPILHPPVFLLGAPRSGSTLAFQVLTDALDFGYMSNRHCQWFGAPALAEHMFRPTAKRPQSDYRSSQGKTQGAYAPAECGQWWYRFFRRKPAYMTLDEVNPREMRRFRQSVLALTNAFGRPILFKNLYASLRIQAIAHYLPESLFIVIHRDEVDNGHSLLEARFKRFGSYDSWFSVEPREVERLKALPTYEQVIEQIRHIHAHIDADLTTAGVSRERRFNLPYKDLCADPRGLVEEVRNFLVRNDAHITRRDISFPAFSPRAHKVRIDQEVYDAMVTYARVKPTIDHG